MLAKLRTFSLVGIDALPVEVEVDVSPGAIPKTVLVGLPEAAVKESTHRVERAMVNSGFLRPSDRVVINLAPADLPKQAASFDLPITLGMLAGSGQIRLRAVRALRRRRRTGPRRQHAAHQGRAVDGHGCRQTTDCAGWSCPPPAPPRPPWSKASRSLPSPAWRRPWRSSPARSRSSPRRRASTSGSQSFRSYDVDFADVRGQEMAKRAVTIAAAGGHNLLMLGPPGSGKTMLAKRHAHDPAGPDARRESIETTRIYSAMGLLDAGPAALGHASLPLAASHHQRRRPGRRRLHARARRDQPGAQRRAVSRRAARVQPPHAGSAAAAAGRRHGHHLAGLVEHDVPGQLHADRRAQPLPLRLSQRPAPRLPLHGAADRALHVQDQRARCWTASTSTSKCPPCRSASCRPPRPARPAPRCANKSSRPARSRPRRFAGSPTRHNGRMTHRQIRAHLQARRSRQQPAAVPR